MRVVARRGDYVWMRGSWSGHWYLARGDGKPLLGGEVVKVVDAKRVPSDLLLAERLEA